MIHHLGRRREMPTADDPRPRIDTQTLSDADTYIYETVATLEYSGQLADRGTIASAAGLDDETVDKELFDLTARGLLMVRNTAGALAYAPAHRDWSTMPDRASGHPMA